MRPAALPANELERLNALREYQLLDTLPEEVYDDITSIASEITGTPIALLNLIDEKRVWTKSMQGIEVTDTPREISFCAHAILDPDVITVIEDTRFDERFDDNPFTTSKPGIIFYAGVPVVDTGGHALGTLCIMDNRPRTLPENKLLALKSLAKLVNAHFELRKTKLELERIHEYLREAARLSVVNNPTVANQAQLLVGLIETDLKLLITNSPRSDQSSYLNSLRQAIDSLKMALDEKKAD